MTHFQELVLQFDTKTLARLCGCSYPTVERWKRGVNHPAPNIQKRLEQVLENTLNTGAKLEL